ncbi:hybrid sensor histidine kinase/response regulator, partial [Pseudoduganella sp. RAF53_2]
MNMAPARGDNPATGWQPHGGAVTGTLVRALDWSATAIGPMSCWSPALRNTVDLVLNTPIAMVLMWGPSHTMIYNDGYIAIAGARHPRALGGTVPEIWPEIWDWNREMLTAGLGGEIRQHNNVALTLMRNGHPEEIWFDLAYTPVYQDDGSVGGVLCTVLEVT